MVRISSGFLNIDSSSSYCASSFFNVVVVVFVAEVVNSVNNGTCEEEAIASMVVLDAGDGGGVTDGLWSG